MILKLEKEIVKRLIGKNVKLSKRAGNGTDPNRTSFKIYCQIQEVTDTSIVIFTDHIGVLLLDDIVGIEEVD